MSDLYLIAFPSDSTENSREGGETLRETEEADKENGEEEESRGTTQTKNTWGVTHTAASGWTRWCCYNCVPRLTDDKDLNMTAGRKPIIY